TRWSARAGRPAPRSSRPRTRSAAATRGCRGSSRSAAAPTSSCRASGRCATWPATRPDESEEPMRDYHDTPPWRAVRFAAGQLDRRVGWDRLWRPVGLGVLIGLRDTLRRDNLFDPSTEVALNPQPLPPEPPGARTARTADGSYNDLD